MAEITAKIRSEVATAIIDFARENNITTEKAIEVLISAGILMLSDGFNETVFSALNIRQYKTSP